MMMQMPSILTCNYLVQLFYVFHLLWFINFYKSDNFTMDEIILMTLWDMLLMEISQM